MYLIGSEGIRWDQIEAHWIKLVQIGFNWIRLDQLDQPGSDWIKLNTRVFPVSHWNQTAKYFILPITNFGLRGRGGCRSVNIMPYFGRIGTWWSRRHGGHGAVVFNWMYFWAEYSFPQDLTACLLLIWVGDNLVLASRLWRLLLRLLWRRRRMELSTMPLTVFVPSRPSFALRVDFSAACKAKNKKTKTLSTCLKQFLKVVKSQKVI